MELADVPRVLERLRTGPAAWGEVTCAFEGEGTAWRDAHATTRRAALLGLQYDRRPEDRELVMRCGIEGGNGGTRAPRSMDSAASSRAVEPLPLIDAHVVPKSVDRNTPLPATPA
mgnify:CR=1 FL=1